MEYENELGKNGAKETDDGFSEKKLAKQVDLIVASQQSQAAQIFTSKKKTQTVFQAPKAEEKWYNGYCLFAWAKSKAWNTTLRLHFVTLSEKYTLGI